MQNNIMILNHDLCTGCGMCEAVCPKRSIKIEIKEEGFYQPSLNQEICINCGLCIKFCAKFNNEKEENTYLEIYALKNKNRKILKKSSSGGVSYEIMKFCIENGYKIFGATYDYEKEITISVIEKNKEKLSKFFGSKYMQSYTVNSLKEIVNDKTEQKYVIFGTPCQIYALNKYAELNNKRDKFLFIDLFCHGCPSLNLWKKYLQDRKEQYGCNNFDEIEFRSKVNGWHEYSFLFIKQNQKYKTDKLENNFNELFFSNDFLNKSCYSCKYRSTLKYTDIRLGDFWGDQYDLDKEGVSATVVCTERGKVILDLIKNNFIFQRHKLEEVIIFQSYGKNHMEDTEKRKKYLDLLSSEIKLAEFIKIYRKNYKILKKIKINLKKLSYFLPQEIRNYLKKYYHKIFKRKN